LHWNFTPYHPARRIDFFTTTLGGNIMAIANAVERSSAIYIYNENGIQTAVSPLLGHGSNDGLKGYTSSTVNILSNGTIYSYDERGTQTAAYPA
jgi:hypothetical protein